MIGTYSSQRLAFCGFYLVEVPRGQGSLDVYSSEADLADKEPAAQGSCTAADRKSALAGRLKRTSPTLGFAVSRK